MGNNNGTNTSRELGSGITLIVVCILLIIVNARDVFNSFMTPKDLYELPLENVTKNAYVYADIDAALDYFMYEEVSRMKYGVEMSSHVSSYYYIIPIGEYQYMAVEVDASDASTMNRICDETYNYLIGEENKLGLFRYRATGSLRDMKDDEIQFMVEWFQSTEYFGTTDKNEIMEYIYPIMLKKDNSTVAKVMLVVGLILGFVGLLMVNHCRKKQKREKKEQEYYYQYYQEQMQRQQMNQPQGYNPQGNMNQPQGYNPQGNTYQPQGYNPQGNMNQSLYNPNYDNNPVNNNQNNQNE